MPKSNVLANMYDSSLHPLIIYFKNRSQPYAFSVDGNTGEKIILWYAPLSPKSSLQQYGLMSMKICLSSLHLVDSTPDQAFGALSGNLEDPYNT